MNQHAHAAGPATTTTKREAQITTHTEVAWLHSLLGTPLLNVFYITF